MLNAQSLLLFSTLSWVWSEGGGGRWKGILGREDVRHKGLDLTLASTVFQKQKTRAGARIMEGSVPMPRTLGFIMRAMETY